MRFEWDPLKAASNLARHGISFDEASTVFGDPLATTIADPDHTVEANEQRWLITGLSLQQRLLIVWHTDSDYATRIIGARQATARERRIYESGE